jgi:hypothetical protein
MTKKALQVTVGQPRVNFITGTVRNGHKRSLVAD